ncbi:MAG: hypothetical protein JXB00_09535 [Bacteroidales bacterium]|nr:hypothetical protein [Bacteroidales bacterium]
MNSWLLFLVKSTLVFSLLYLLFRFLMRDETFFRISRLLLLFIVFTSLIIPFINLPQSYHPIVSIQLNPIIQGNSRIDKPFQIAETNVITNASTTDFITDKPIEISPKTVIIFIYHAGAIVSLLLLVYSIFSVLRLFKKSRKVTVNGIQLSVINSDIPAFTFMRHILISQHDYNTNSDEIITHELSHIKHGHFYDLMLLELIKIIYWFNPLVYKMIHDLKDIHEFQADEQTLNSGVNSTKYQLLIIQKCVGHQSFALANSFYHCQIKKRITMMNKSKTSKAWYWKVATFLPLLALLLMAFGNLGEIVPEESSLPVTALSPSNLVQTQQEQFKRKIEIKTDGNYIDNKLCSLQEIAKKSQEWYNSGNDWILLLIDESIPLSRVDEVREALVHDYWIIQSIVNSDDQVYFSGDVSELAKFTLGNFNEWINLQLENSTEVKSKNLKYAISFSFIVGKNGKVRDGHIIKGSDYPEINAAYEKILSQIPDWEPAKRSGENVSVYNHIKSGGTIVLKE